MATKSSDNIENGSEPVLKISKKVNKNTFDILSDMIPESLLLSLQLVLQFLPIIITMQMIGRYYIKTNNSDIYLSGSGLARTFSNTFNLAFSYSLTSGLWTLIPQTLGSSIKDNKLYKKLITIYMQRCFYIITFSALILSIPQYFGGNIMILIGQPYILKDIINNYCRLLIPYGFLICWNTMFETLIQSLGYNKMLFILKCFTFTFDILCLYITIFVMDLGYIGGGISAVLFMFVTLVGNIFILYRIDHLFILKPVDMSLVFERKGIKQYLSLSLPGILQTAFEWIVIEIVVILSGYIVNPTVSISTAIIITNIDLIVYAFQTRIQNLMSIKIGKYIGSGMIKMAKKYSWIGVIYSTVISLIFMISLHFTRNIISYLWTKDINIIKLTAKTLDVYILYIFNNTFKTSIPGIYSGLGYQKHASYFVVIGYWFISIPLCLILLFVPPIKWKNDLYLGTSIIWWSMVLGSGVAGYGIMIHILCGCIKYEHSVDESKQRITINVKEFKKYGSFN